MKGTPQANIKVCRSYIHWSLSPLFLAITQLLKDNDLDPNSQL